MTGSMSSKPGPFATLRAVEPSSLATSSIPETVDFSTLKTNPHFHAQIEEIRRTLLARGGYVVYVRGLGRDTFLPSEASLRRLLSLQLVRSAPDGAIYKIAGEP